MQIQGCYLVYRPDKMDERHFTFKYRIFPKFILNLITGSLVFQLTNSFILAFLAFLAPVPLSAQSVMRVDGPIRVNNGYTINIGNQTLQLAQGADIVLSRQLPISRLKAGSAGQITGNTSSRFIDGWVQKTGSTPFHFPLGESSSSGLARLSPLGLTNISLAFKKESPTTIGTSVGPGLTALSDQQFWQSAGQGSGYLTLTWGPEGMVGTLTGNDLSKLTIAGWHTTASEWQRLPAIADVSSLPAGSSSTPLQGSLTTVATVDFAAYSAFTLATQDECLILPPSIDAIVQPTCTPPKLGSVLLSGLPAGSWMLLISGPDGEEIRSGNGPSYTVTNLSPGVYRFSVMDNGGCTSPLTSPFGAILVEY